MLLVRRSALRSTRLARHFTQREFTGAPPPPPTPSAASPSAPSASPSDNLIIDVDEENLLPMVMQAPMPVILDAWAPWCQPCLQLAPKLEAEVRAQNGRLRLAKVNTDDNQRIAQQLQITVSKRESMTGLSVCPRVRVRAVVCWCWCTMVHARRVVKVCNVCSRLAVWRGVCDVCTSDVYQYTKQTSTMMCTHTHVVGWMAYCDTYATHVTAILPLSRWQRHPSVPYSIPVCTSS